MDRPSKPRRMTRRPPRRMMRGMWSVSSETGRLTDVLLCRPEHYQWVPHNAVARRVVESGAPPPGPAQIAAQHAEFADALAGAGVRLHWLEPEPHLPSMTYTRDQSVVTPWGPLLCQLERPARRGEYAALHRFHEGRFWRLASAGTIEGGDVQILRPGLALIGLSGERTDEAGANQLAAWLREEGWEVRLERFDGHFLHIDLLCCLVAPGLALLCREVLGDSLPDWLAARGIRGLDVSYAEAMRLGCNALALGEGRVVSARENLRVNAVLRAEGLSVLDPELSVFTMGGGGPHCLTGPLRREG